MAQKLAPTTLPASLENPRDPIPPACAAPVPASRRARPAAAEGRTTVSSAGLFPAPQAPTARESSTPRAPEANFQRPMEAPSSPLRQRQLQAHLRPGPAPASAPEISAANPPNPRPELSESPACPCAVPGARASPWPRRSHPAPSPPGKSNSESRSHYPGRGSARDCPPASPSPPHLAVPTQAAYEQLRPPHPP